MHDWRRHLLPGEELVWTGRPAQGLMLVRADAFLIPFSLFWGGFALFWNIGVWTQATPLFFKLFGLPFLAMGLYITLGRFWIDAAMREDTQYAITDRRVLISRTNWLPTLKSLDIRHLPALELTERGDGTGTIKFGTAIFPFWSGGFDLGLPGFSMTPQFFYIQDARRVYGLLQEKSR